MTGPASTTLARAIARDLPGLRVSDDDADRVAYARDLWPRQHLAVRAGRPAEYRPGAIAWPASTEEVAALVRWASERGTALVPFGAGSGVCAGVRPDAGLVVMDLKRLARVRAIDAGAPTVDVEAGHMGLPLERALGRAGFTLGHFPSSILCSTVGGWVAARSAGQCSSAYGKIEDMVVALECVTGRGEVVTLRRRASGPDLVPLVVGSEGTMAVVTRATLRLHPAPRARAFGAWSFATTRRGCEAMREMLQTGLRPAVARLYDPFDALMARRARGKRGGGDGAGEAPGDAGPHEPGLGGLALRAILRRPRPWNDLVHADAAGRALGGALLVVVCEGDEAAVARDLDRARSVVASRGGQWVGDGPARRWFERRYAVSYRQAPLFARGVFVDTFEVAARWSAIEATYEAVRRAIGERALVTAHFSHGYPDGCCIYFSFAGGADPALVPDLGWDGACEVTYDRAWRDALAAATSAGATLAHHHGVGRSKAPRLPDELGAGVGVVRALMRAFDPRGVLNPGNLVPPAGPAASPAHPIAPRVEPRRDGSGAADAPARASLDIDHQSLLARVDGGCSLGELERRLNAEGLTLDVRAPGAEGTAVADWLAQGAPGARDRWLDPADQVLAGFDATLADGRALSVRPAPRRAVGPDLAALFVGTHDRFGRLERAYLRVHRRGVARPTAAPFEHDRDPPLGAGEGALLDAVARSLADRST